VERLRDLVPLLAALGLLAVGGVIAVECVAHQRREERRSEPRRDAGERDAGLVRRRRLAVPSPGFSNTLPPSVLAGAAEEPEPAPAWRALEEAFCDPLVAALCRARRACGCVTDYAVDETCEDVERAACQDWLSCASWADPAEARLEVDRARLARCLRAATSELDSCRGGPLPPTCQQLLVEPVDVGGTCGDEYGLCRGGQCEEGGCRPFPGPGETCHRFCAAGARCSFVDGLCHADDEPDPE
jgi:hypothetical protein